MKEHRIIGALAIIVLGFCIAGRANAQQPWDTNVVGIAAPSTCSTGEPVTACPVTGYRLERSATSSGPFATLAALPSSATGYTHNSVTAGVNCYRAFALSAQGDSVASNIVCKTNTKPVGPPNPPVLKVIDTVAYNVVPDLQHFMFFAGSRIATVKLGSACDETRRTEDGFNVISRLTQVTPRPKAGTVLVAKCG